MTTFLTPDPSVLDEQPITVQCPAWCTKPDGHDLAPRDWYRGAARRIHFGAPVIVDGFRVEVEQFEVVHLDGAIQREPARATIDHCDEDEPAAS